MRPLTCQRMINAEWDSIRLSGDYIEAMRAGDLDAVIKTFGDKKLIDFPSYLTNLSNRTGLTKADLEELSIQELHNRIKEDAPLDPLFQLNDFLIADTLRNTMASSRNVAYLFDEMKKIGMERVYDPREGTLVVRPRGTVMSAMNYLGYPKEYYELMDPDTARTLIDIASVNVGAPFGLNIPLNPSFLVSAYSPDFSRMLPRFSGPTGVKEDLLYNMRSMIEIGPREQESRINAAIKYLEANDKDQFDNYAELQLFTNDPNSPNKQDRGEAGKFVGDPEQIYDDHSIKLLLGADRLTQTIIGIPYKPSVLAPSSLTDELLAMSNSGRGEGLYDTIHDYDITDTADRVLASQLLGMEGAMGRHRMIYERAGYSPGSPGYVAAQSRGIISDAFMDPIDPVLGGSAKTLKFAGAFVKGARTARGLGDIATGAKLGWPKTFRKGLDNAMMSMASEKGALGMAGRAWSYLDVDIDDIKQPLQNGTKIDAQIRDNAQAIVDAAPSAKARTGQIAKDAAGRAAMLALASLIIDPEAVAEYALQRGLAGAARGALDPILTVENIRSREFIGSGRTLPQDVLERAAAGFSTRVRRSCRVW
jgi:hypothetical protein